MDRVQNSESGFTLLEIMVAVGIVAMLGAAMTPQFMGQLDKAKRARAMSDMNAIGSGLQRFYEDTGRMPGVNVGGSDVGAHTLVGTVGMQPSWAGGNSPCWSAIDGVCWGSYWKGSIKSALILNTPGYANWNGPYLNQEKADPWGRHYAVSIFGMTYYLDCAASSDYWCRNSVVVASAGPNGRWETDPHFDRSECGWVDWDPKPCGDDLLVVVVNRAGTTRYRP